MTKMSKEAGATLLAMFRGSTARFRLENPGCIHLLQQEIDARTAKEDAPEPEPEAPVQQDIPIDPEFRAKLDRVIAAEEGTLEHHLALHDVDTHYGATHYVDIAKAAYEAVRAYAAIGGAIHGHWSQLTDEVKLNTINNALAVLANPEVPVAPLGSTEQGAVDIFAAVVNALRATYNSVPRA